MNPVLKRMLNRLSRSAMGLCSGDSSYLTRHFTVEEHLPDDSLMVLVIGDAEGRSMQSMFGFESGVIYTMQRLFADKMGIEVTAGYSAGNLVLTYTRRRS